MDLQPFHGMLAMPYSHDDVGRGPRGHPQLRWQRLLGDDQRVVSRGEQGGVEPAEDTFTIVVHEGLLAVQDLASSNYLTAVCFRDALVTEADPENPHSRSEPSNDSGADACVLG